MRAIPDRYCGSSAAQALCLLAEVLDPPAPEEAAADPARWRAAVANVRATLPRLPTGSDRLVGSRGEVAYCRSG